MSSSVFRAPVTPRQLGTPVAARHDGEGTIRPANPFDAPNTSRPVSLEPGSVLPSSSAGRPTARPQPYFRSRRLAKGAEIEKPWLTKRDPREKWHTIIPLIGLFAGLSVFGLIVWDGYRKVVNHKYCLVLDEDWSGGINHKIWTPEIELGGFGNGQFEQTTASASNLFVNNNILTIKPTLQDESLITKNSTINLTKLHTCTSPHFLDCVAVTNTTNGTIVPPVLSARINSKAGARIKYGRVEVTAKLPLGDWLWPAIWMMPVTPTYGVWPQSGEIDIAEARGNNHSYTDGGNDIISSALHWGPNKDNDAWWRTHIQQNIRHATFTEGFHTFGLEWSEKYLFTYIGTRLGQVLYTPFTKPFWKRGHFPLSDGNGTTLVDPWSQTGRASTPFDEDFYLILDVAVGGTNGWFEDGKGGKPWVDASPTAKRDFWEARDIWGPTWGKGGWMEVGGVRMWQQEGYHGC